MLADCFREFVAEPPEVMPFPAPEIGFAFGKAAEKMFLHLDDLRAVPGLPSELDVADVAVVSCVFFALFGEGGLELPGLLFL